MHDLGNQPLNDDPSNERSLEPGAHALTTQPGTGDHRTELYERLRTIIDNATESLRVLKDENAALLAQNAALEQHVRTVTADLASDELALRESAEVLERVLQETPTGTTAPAPISAPHAEAEETPAMEVPTPQPSMPQPEPEAAMPVMEQAVPSSMEETGPIPQPEPPSAPIARDESERVIAPRPASKPDGTYTLIAYPFVRFSDLGQFQAALQKLAGVHDVQVRRFAQGTLEMQIGYSGATDLATTLRTLVAEIEDVREEEPDRLRVRLRTTQDS